MADIGRLYSVGRVMIGHELLRADAEPIEAGFSSDVETKLESAA